MRRVALLIETSRAYGRGLLRGVARYSEQCRRWSVCFRPRGLDDPPPEWLEDWRGDGILARINTRQMAAAVIHTGLPVVELRRRFPGLGLAAIGADNRAVTQLAVEHLVEKGFRHVGFCGLPARQYAPMDERRAWFTRLLEERGFHPSVYPARRAPGRGDTWTRELNDIARWVASLPRPVGVMACNDDRGLQVLGACQLAGLRVPDDVAVIGVDNDEYLCRLSVPPLTSIDLGSERVGYEAARLLDRMMDGRVTSAPQLVFPPRGVVSRRSTEVLATDDQAVVRAASFIRVRACGPILVKDVSRHARLSRSALEPRLRRVLGRTIHQEIQRVRIERVKELLRTSDLAVKAIAARCGFRDARYMARAFRRVTGQTPAGYRREWRSGAWPEFVTDSGISPTAAPARTS